jgi:hypothetical protein
LRHALAGGYRSEDSKGIGAGADRRIAFRRIPKNKRDPMICLNGACYVTFYNKPAR